MMCAQRHPENRAPVPWLLLQATLHGCSAPAYRPMGVWPYQGISYFLRHYLFNLPNLGPPIKQSRYGTCLHAQQSRRSRKAEKYGASRGVQNHPLLVRRVHSLVVAKMDTYGGGDPLVAVRSVGTIACHTEVFIFQIVTDTKFAKRMENLPPSHEALTHDN